MSYCTTAPGVYVSDGYFSMLQADANNFKERIDKTVNKVAVEFISEEQTTPNLLHVNIAFGSQPNCMTWDRSAPAKKLECLTDRTRRRHQLRNTRPNEMPTFKFWRRGVYLAWRFYVKGTGGCSCFNMVELSVKKASGNWS